MTPAFDGSPSPRPERSGPLTGVSVLDLTIALAGPYCTQVLADLGADVIKVESPDGDTTRYLGAGRHRDRGGMFLNMNRGKRSIALDLKRPDGRRTVLRLATGTDVFVHSMRRPALERLGLSYAEVSAANPAVVYVALTGFGRDGPYADLPAYDDVIQAASGLAMLQGQAAGSEPTYVATVLADKATGLSAAYATLAALFHRERTGEGQEIEVPMFETTASFVMLEHITGAVFDPPLSGPTYGRVVSPDRRPYRTSDGYISVMVYNDGQWRRFLAALGHPDWGRDTRFASISSRSEHVDFVLGTLSRVMQERSTSDWLVVLRAAEIPAMPLLSTDDLFTDEHLESVGFWKRMEIDGERFRFAGIPTMFSRTPGRITGPGPALGEHGPEVLAEHGFSAEEIDALVADGVLVGSALAASAPDRAMPADRGRDGPSGSSTCSSGDDGQHDL